MQWMQYVFARKDESMKYREEHLPMAFFGWAGQNSEIGPVIRINAEHFSGDEEVRVFYADSDYRGRMWEDEDGKELLLNENAMWELESLARSIQNLSSGLTDGRVQILTPEDGSDPFYAATYRLDKKAVKDLMVVDGKTHTADEAGGYLVVFQRYGEFTATLGVLRNGKPVVLYQDSCAMK